MIETIEQYNELATATDTAEDCLESLRYGSHYALMQLLEEKHGIRTDKLGAIKSARKLCNDYLDRLSYGEIE